MTCNDQYIAVSEQSGEGETLDSEFERTVPYN